MALMAFLAAAAAAAAAATEEEAAGEEGRLLLFDLWDPLDISWMNENQKQLLDNFITLWKLQQTTFINVSALLCDFL